MRPATATAAAVTSILGAGAAAVAAGRYASDVALGAPSGRPFPADRRLTVHATAAGQVTLTRSFAALRPGTYGLVGDDGPTHHGAFDISYFRALPNVVVMAPRDEAMLVHMLRTALAHDDGPIAFRYPRGAAEEFIQGNPTKRYGEADEIASVVAFLLSDDAAYVNAAVLPIDGGQSAKY